MKPAACNIELCPVRDVCAQHTAGLDGYGVRVRTVDSEVRRKHYCGHETAGTVITCALRRRLSIDADL